jgi:HK97 family phage major capsid protein
MTKEELDKLIAEKTAEALNGAIGPALEGALAQVKANWNPNPQGNISEEEVKKETKINDFKSYGEFLTSIWRARNLGIGDNRLRYLGVDGKVVGNIDSKILSGINQPMSPEAAAKTAMAGSTDSTGGFLIPEEYRAQLLALEQEESVVRASGAWVIPMSGDTLSIPRVNETSRSASLFGGATASWTAEAASMNESEPAFGQAKVEAHELTGYSVCSNTLMADNAVGLESFLRRVLTEVPAFYEDYAFLNGSGAGEPLGILNSGCLISVTRKATSGLHKGDITGLYARILPKSRGKGKWVLNYAVLPALLDMHSYDGAQSSGANLIWINQNQGGLQNAVPGTILGRPYVETEKVPTLYSAGDVSFFDFSYYIIGDRSALTIDASSHIGFTTNQTYWRFVKRVGGTPWLASALTPKNGNTLSPFVSLGATS